MTNFSHGRAAEEAAVNYLKGKKYKIIAQNWRTRYCEIDIIAKRKKTIYFVEVKYRASSAQGGGLEYITPRKLKQMELASRFWISDNNWSGDYTLAAIEVSGPNYQITNFLTEL